MASTALNEMGLRPDVWNANSRMKRRMQYVLPVAGRDGAFLPSDTPRKLRLAEQPKSRYPQPERSPEEVAEN
jgi:hypothetical protein